MTILPRQARDKHRENSKKARFVEASVAMMQMAPTVLMNRFGLTVAEAGRYIALGFSITVRRCPLTTSSHALH